MSYRSEVATLSQKVVLIVLDSVEQCNNALIPEAEYRAKLKQLLEERLGHEVNVDVIIDTFVEPA